jgi:SlyX protein
MTSSDERRLDAARIDELEMRLAEQDRSIVELSDELYRQQRQIAQLEAQLRQLAERVRTLSPSEPAPDPAGEIPPHY